MRPSTGAYRQQTPASVDEETNNRLERQGYYFGTVKNRKLSKLFERFSIKSN
jgi:hypothetical protein